MDEMSDQILALAAQIITAQVTHHRVSPEALPRLIEEVVQSLRSARQQAAQPEKPKPAVPIHQSVTRDAVACLECGKRFRTMKRHLERQHGMTEDEYRARWDLPASYRLTAPEYADLRADVARKIGLGRKPRSRGRK